MGDGNRTKVSFGFNRSIRVEGVEERLSSEGGALFLREVDERIGMSEWLAANLVDSRNPVFTTHPLRELIRTRMLLTAQGWIDQDDADRLRRDAALLLAISDQGGDRPLEAGRGLASQPTLSRLTSMLATESNRSVLRASLLETSEAVRQAARSRPAVVTIDIDSTDFEVHGHQAGGVYNGYFRHTCYHPLIAWIHETSEIVDVQLRDGNAHTADGAAASLRALLPRVATHVADRVRVRADAGFPAEPLLQWLENPASHCEGYGFRLRNNSALRRIAEEILAQIDDPTAETTFELDYEAGSWSRRRRLVAVVQPRPGELFPHVFFLLTNFSVEVMSGPALLAWYRRRGIAEAHLGELKSTIDPRFSCTIRDRVLELASGEIVNMTTTGRDGAHVRACNEVTLVFACLAYNLMNVVRRAAAIAKPNPSRKPVDPDKPNGPPPGWTLRRVREQLLRVACRVTQHARQVRVYVPVAARDAWAAILAVLLPGVPPRAGAPAPATG